MYFPYLRDRTQVKKIPLSAVAIFVSGLYPSIEGAVHFNTVKFTILLELRSGKNCMESGTNGGRKSKKFSGLALLFKLTLWCHTGNK